MRCTKVIQKHLRCEVCDDVFTIFRRACKNKSRGHVKHLYCPSCKIVTAHIELGVEDLCYLHSAYSF